MRKKIFFLLLLIIAVSVLLITTGCNGETVSTEIESNNEEQLDLTLLFEDDIRPHWSPDGKKVVFNTNRDGNWEIYIMDADGSNQLNLTNNSSSDDLDPSWSPDGTKIAFVSRRDMNMEIYVMNADGSNQAILTYDPFFYEENEPSWSPLARGK